MSDLIGYYDGVTNALRKARAVNELIRGYRPDNHSPEQISAAAEVVEELFEVLDDNLTSLYEEACKS